eukprot:COSAG01_NODE_951_length_12498_cov_30.544018_6_plen_809_part_00
MHGDQSTLLMTHAAAASNTPRYMVGAPVTLLLALLAGPAWPSAVVGQLTRRERRLSAFQPGLFSDANATMVNSGTPRGVPADADCAVRELAYAFGKSLKPGRGGFRTLYDALQLGACGVPVPTARPEWVPPSSSQTALSHSSTLYVAPVGASSAANEPPTGSAERPFQSVADAVERSRSMTKPVDILLRQGTHAVASTVELGPDDSGIRIANCPGEAAELSGAVPLYPQWKSSSVCGKGCFEAALPSISSILGLRRNGIREIRARWPNFDEELDSVDEHGVYHVHNGRDGWVTVPTPWVMNGSDMNGIAGPWPPTEEARTITVGAEDWPGVHWPMREMVNASNGTLVPTNDQWTGEGDWGKYWLGVGGTCADRTPALGYWCSPTAPRDISPATHPGGIYAQTVRGRQYRDPVGAIIHAWMPYHWYTYMFEVRSAKLQPNSAKQAALFAGTNAIWGQCTSPSTCREGIQLIGNFSSLANCQHAVLNSTTAFQSYTYFHLAFPQLPWRALCYGLRYRDTSPKAQSGVDSGVLASAGQTYLEFARGGFQGGEGVTSAAVNNSNWYIENLLEEIDSPREWFFNSSSRTLYYMPNASCVDRVTGLPTGEFTATGAKVLINITGSQARPAANISLTGLVFRDSSYTYMDEHGLPSGGDWALQKQGAITLVGTLGTTISHNLFTRLDGNAIFMGGFHRGLEISDNDFEFIGDSAMASWGDTSNNLNANGSISVEAPVGPDGRSGNQNRGAKVIGNVCREIGLWQKQSSMWFQAVTAGTQFMNNVFMNGPRAAFNDNDGFGGGDELSNNLLINTCR